MAFPSIASATSQALGSAATAHAVTMPATVNVGDLLLVIITTYGNTDVTTPSGWAALFSQVANSNACKSWGYYRIAAGNEDGTSVDFVTADAVQAVAHIYRITTWHGTTPPEAAAAAGSTTTLDPPSLTPSWGATDTLWIAHAGQQWSDSAEFTPPMNYAARTWAISSGGGSTCSGATASRELNAASEDPGGFTSQVNYYSAVATIGVRPAVASAPTWTPRVTHYLAQQ